MFPVRANPDGYRGVWKWLFGLTNKYDIPCHRECFKAIKSSLLQRNLVLLGMAAFAMLIGFYFGFSRWIVYSLLTLLVIPLIIWQITNPTIVEFMRDNEKMIFSFRNEEYAKAFALLNHSVVEKND
jgi:hypothetical protein